MSIASTSLGGKPASLRRVRILSGSARLNIPGSSTAGGDMCPRATIAPRATVIQGLCSGPAKTENTRRP